MYAYCMLLYCSITSKIPRTHSRKTQRVSPTDTERPAGSAPSSAPSSALSNSSRSFLTAELSALTVAALRTRLRDCNLPASGSKATLFNSRLTTIQLLIVKNLLILLLGKSTLLIPGTIHKLLYNMKPMQQTTLPGLVLKLLPGNQPISHQIYWLN